MSLETFDWYITQAVEQKLEDEEVWGDRSPEVVTEIAAKLKQNIVKGAMIFISKEYMENVINSKVDWDNM